MLLTEQHGSVLLLSLNKPERRNAIDHSLACAIEAALDDLDADDSLHVAVITGGGGYFSAGADLKAAAQGAEPATTERRGNFGLVRRPPNKPLIAAVEGGALGGGFEIVLACDVVVASREAMFGLPEVSHGVLAAAGGCARLPRRIPRNVAMELALTAVPLPASRLYELGLVNRLCESGEALRTALAMAQTIAANAPLALASTKRIIDHATEASEAESWAYQDRELSGIRSSEDYREGIRAFSEKRPPIWKGK